MKVDIKSKRIPDGTKIKVRIETPLNKITSNVGDQFNATVVQDVRSDSDVILPSGTMLRGTIGYIQRSRLLSSGAEILLSFDHIVTPMGKQVPLYAVLTNTENLTLGGGIASGTTYGGEVNKGFTKGKEMAVDATGWGIDTGSSFWRGVPVVVTVPVAATAGTVGGASYCAGKAIVSIFRKGDDVLIAPGKVYEIRLTQPLDIPVN